MTDIRSAPERKVDKINFRPWVSPSLLQKPVDMALRTLIVVTTAEEAYPLNKRSFDGQEARTRLDFRGPRLNLGVSTPCQREIVEVADSRCSSVQRSTGNGFVDLYARRHCHSSLCAPRSEQLSQGGFGGLHTDMDITRTTGMSLQNQGRQLSSKQAPLVV